MQEMRRYLVFLVVPAIFILDRWTKQLVIDNIPYLQGITITSFLSVVHARNMGGAFSLLSQHGSARYVFTFFPLLIIAILIYIMLAYRMALSKRFSLVLILSGAVGNMYDRIFYGYVIDFLDMYYGGYHWPAFNIADMSISTGVGLWLLVELLSYRRQLGKKEKNKGRRASKDTAKGAKPNL
jgi:signal peptidase II